MAPDYPIKHAEIIAIAKYGGVSYNKQVGGTGEPLKLFFKKGFKVIFNEEKM